MLLFCDSLETRTMIETAARILSRALIVVSQRSSFHEQHAIDIRLSARLLHSADPGYINKHFI